MKNSTSFVAAGDDTGMFKNKKTNEPLDWSEIAKPPALRNMQPIKKYFGTAMGLNGNKDSEKLHEMKLIN